MEPDRNDPTPKVEEKKKGRRARPLRILILAIVLGLLLLALWLGRGLGLGAGAQETLSGAVQSVEESLSKELDTAQSVLTEQTAKRDKNVVLVQEQTILYLGEALDGEGLRGALLENYEEGDVTLKDDHAIKAVYDEAKTVLTELDIPFKEE